MLRRTLLAGLLIALTAPAAISQISEEALLDSIQRTAFNYFWNEANPTTGLIKDRDTPGSPASIASTGFGLTAICIGIDHGWITRAEGRDRILAALQTFWTTPQGTGSTGTCGYRGLFYHFLDMSAATRVWNSELSTIDTALLFAGILDAREYFDTGDSLDVVLRGLADSITTRAEWDYMDLGTGIKMGWTPETGFSGFGTWVGYNEAMIMYIIALGSPTYPIPALSWSYWMLGYSWQTQFGQTYVVFPPLFGHQYSHCWVDFRNIQDAYMRNKGIDYFENSRRATLAARQYCIVNPESHIGYSDSLWGLTAGDGPSGYLARGAPPEQNDDGTITPTAAISSIAFAPEVVIPTARHMYNALKSQLWGEYGFRDGFNIDLGWWATDVIGIDQGPIIIMIENYLNGSVWSRFMQNADIQAGLAQADFQPSTGVDLDPEVVAERSDLLMSTPNPFRDVTTIRFRLPESGHVNLTVYNIAGREVIRLVDEVRSAGPNEVTFHGEGLSTGVYYYRLETEGKIITRRCVLLK